jgi:hypothetical protein
VARPNIIDEPWVQRVGRVGWLARGVLYLLIGVLAIQVGAGVGVVHGESSALGAIEAVGDQPFGRVLLIVLGTGLLIYALWRAVASLLPGSGGADSLARRAVWMLSALFHASIGAVALMSVFPGRDGGGGSTPLLRDLMSAGWGRVLVGMIGVGLLAAGTGFVIRGIGDGIGDEIDYRDMPDRWRRPIEILGTIGWVSRAVVVGLVGLFLLVAAVTYDVDAAQGLDGTLRDLAANPWGAAVVVASGAGLLAFGLFCALTFPYRRLAGP